MKTLTIEDAALELAALLDIETPDGDSSPEFRLQFARTMRKPDIEAALIAAATDEALRLRHVDGGYVPAGAPVSVSSQVGIDEARAVLEVEGWQFVSPPEKVGAGATAVSTLPPGIPTGTIVQKFKLTKAWESKLKHIKANPFLKHALMRQGCRKNGKTPVTSHLWNPVRLAEILIDRDGRNRRAMEAIITHHFSNWQDVWHESVASDDEDDEYAA